MALTISTGFVVDDAIVMIENIARYIEEGEPPLRGRAQGRRADRLHDRLADRFADRGADSAAVHGRHRRPAVPRIRGHAGRHHPGFGGRLADADADDVRAKLLHHDAESEQSRVLPGLGARVSSARSTSTAARCDGCCGTQPATLLVAVGTLVLTMSAVFRRAQGLFPGAGHRRDPGHLRGAADDLVRRDGAAAAGAGAGDSAGSRRSQSLSSFIGIDGTNTTLNSGRILINLKPLDERDAERIEPIIDRLQPQAGAGRRDHAVHAAGAGPDGRGSREPHAVSVQPRGSRAPPS